MTAVRVVQPPSKQEVVVAAKNPHACNADTQACVLPHWMLRLQQTIGNQAVKRVLRSAVILANRPVSQPGDQYGQAANGVADDAMEMRGDAGVSLGPVVPSRTDTGLAGCASGGSVRDGEPGKAGASFYLPGPGGESRTASESGSSHGVTPSPTAATKCKVKRFGMEFDRWNVDWPDWFSDTSTVRLPAEFELELDKGSKREDCLVGQDRRGRVELGGKVDEFPRWTSDSEPGFRYWWDGKKWNAGLGSWDWHPFGGNESAEFEDEPGLNDAERWQYPLYYGGVGHRGHFEFETYVMDKGSGAIVRRLTWGLLIDYSAPQRGRRYFYR